MTAAPTQPQTGYATVNGLKLYYEIHGPGGLKDPPLVLLHGGGSTIQTSFGKILPLLAKSRRIIAFDQQGHGHTADIPDRPFSFSQSADDAVALLHFLKIDKADFFGYSNGGHIALQIAISHPDVVRKLIVESAMFSREGSDPQFWEGFKTAKLAEMPAELREEYTRVAPDPEALPSFFNKSVERMKNFKGWSPDEIRGIKVPTLILLGDHDIVRPEHAAEMLRLIKNSQLAVLPGTDHMSIVNKSDVVPALVETFLKSAE